MQPPNPLTKAEIHALSDADLPMIAKMTRAHSNRIRDESMQWLAAAKRAERELNRRLMAREMWERNNA